MLYSGWSHVGTRSHISGGVSLGPMSFTKPIEIGRGGGWLRWSVNELRRERTHFYRSALSMVTTLSRGLRVAAITSGFWWTRNCAHQDFAKNWGNTQWQFGSIFTYNDKVPSGCCDLVAWCPGDRKSTYSCCHIRPSRGPHCLVLSGAEVHRKVESVQTEGYYDREE